MHGDKIHMQAADEKLIINELWPNNYSKYCVRFTITALQVIARTVATLSPTDVLDRPSGQTAAGELVSFNAECKDFAEHLFSKQCPHLSQVTTSSTVPVLPYNASLVNLDVSETRRTSSGQAAAGELVSLKMQGLSRAQLHIMNTFSPGYPQRWGSCVALHYISEKS